MKDRDIRDFSHSEVKDVFSIVQSSEAGLTENDVSKRLSTIGQNTLQTTKRSHVIIEFLLNFKSPLVVILMVVASISIFLGEAINAVIVMSMVAMSVGLNFLQEHRASLAAEKLKSRVSSKTMVIRDGIAVEVNSVGIVPGDVLELNAGDLVPADARLFWERDLFVSQSALTGESFPVEKTINPIESHRNDLTDMRNILFAGTSIVTGAGKAVVIKTGSSTEFGKIAEKLANPRSQNEFTKGIESFSSMVLRIIVIFVVFIFLANSFIKHDIIESLLFSIAVAVGLTPEFLPMIMTVNMSRGSQSMARKGVIVKKLTAIPTFGSMDILCTDKTGTLTEDRIHLVKYTNISGKESEDVFQYAYLNSYYQTGITNPMDKAVVDYKKIDISEYKKVDEIPFDFERKRMSVVISSKKDHILITKGAPEEILKVSSTYLDGEVERKLTHRKKEIIMGQFEKLSKDGFRTLAIAKKKIPSSKTIYTKADENEMNIVGFVSFLDPARAGVKDSIDQLEIMGIEMKVLTGDNEFVTQKICIDADINVKGTLLGSQIDSFTDEQLFSQCMATTIFARCSPSQKNRIITCLRSRGKVVGYMGDGINDAPSLKAADVGISVANGVDVAKESADIILTHKSLKELKDGVIEGRKTFGNTMKYIMMGLSSNFGNMFSVLGAVLFLPFLPMLPIQILLNNFLYDLGQITLPTDRVDKEYLEKPKRWSNKTIRNFMIIFGPISSLFDYLSFFVLFVLFKNAPAAFQTGWFMESLATQTLVIHIIRTRKIPFLQSNASMYLWVSTSLVVAIGWIIPMTPLAHFFGFVTLPFYQVALISVIVAIYLLCVEAGKRVFYNSRLAS